MDIENSLTFLLMQTSIVYRNQFQKVMNEIGLHSGQVFVLFSLWKEDGQSQIDLVKNLKLSPPTINKMIKSLDRSGFVKCQKCSQDGRMMRVFLTEKGLQSKTAVEVLWEKFELQSFSKLTETEKLILMQLFRKLQET